MPQLDARANRYAHWALAQGIKQGDCVALLMENRPDFLCCLAGAVQGGRCGGADQHQSARPAAGPFHRDRRRPPCDCGRRAGGLRCRSRSLSSRAKPQVWVQGATGGNLDAALDAASPLSPGPGAARRRHRPKDRAFFIYTSGTTGLPKAANFSHMRMLFMMTGFVGRAAAAAAATASTIPCRSIMPPAGSAPWAWPSWRAARW